MKHLWNSLWTNLPLALSALALSALAFGHASAAPQTPEPTQLLTLGFKVLVATTKVQEDWVRSLKPGKMRPMQRNGKKYFIFPDSPRNQVYVGGPRENEAYLQLHPESDTRAKQEAANSAYRVKQNDVMRKATARDLSDPFLGVSWADLGW